MICRNLINMFARRKKVLEGPLTLDEVIHRLEKVPVEKLLDGINRDVLLGKWALGESPEDIIKYLKTKEFKAYTFCRYQVFDSKHAQRHYIDVWYGLNAHQIRMLEIDYTLLNK